MTVRRLSAAAVYSEADELTELLPPLPPRLPPLPSNGDKAGVCLTLWLAESSSSSQKVSADELSRMHSLVSISTSVV